MHIKFFWFFVVLVVAKFYGFEQADKNNGLTSCLYFFECVILVILSMQACANTCETVTFVSCKAFYLIATVSVFLWLKTFIICFGVFTSLRYCMFLVKHHTLYSNIFEEWFTGLCRYTSLKIPRLLMQHGFRRLLLRNTFSKVRALILLRLDVIPSFAVYSWIPLVHMLIHKG